MMMISRTLIAALAATLLTSVASFGAPVLKTEVNVVASVVTVGDMFDDAGLLAEAALFRAPLPGTTGTVPLAAIKAAAARVGLVDFDSAGLMGVRVIRQSSIVDEEVLTQLIAQDLATRGILTPGMSAQAMFDRAIAPMNAEATSTPVTLMQMRYLPANGAFTARFAVAGFEQPIDVTGTLDLMIPAPHLAANLPAGTILSAQDIVMRLVPLKFAETTGFASVEQLIGQQLQRQSREGMLLKPADVGAAQLISRNDFVTIYFRKGPLTLTVKGQAVSTAALGGPVQVLNLMSNRVITATAIAAGAVEISSGPVDVAGL